MKLLTNPIYMKRIIFIAGIALGFLSQGYGQVYSNKVVGEKNISEADSIESQPYPYSLPIWGAKATARGLQF